MENAGQELVACLFQREDTLQEAAAVLSLSVSDVTEAERMLRSLINTVSAEERGKAPLITFCYTANKAYPVYRLPQTTLFTQLTSFVEPSLLVLPNRHRIHTPHFMKGVCCWRPMKIVCPVTYASWIKARCSMER